MHSPDESFRMEAVDKWIEEISLQHLAHDLRGPLSPLLTAAYLLRHERDDTTRQAELLDLVERQGQRLARMVDELGDWARAGQGTLLGTRERSEAGVLVDLALGELPGAPALVVTVDENVAHADVDGDQARLQQLLRTLVEHALAEGDGQAPTVHATRQGDRMQIDIRASGDMRDPNVADLLAQPQAAPTDEGLGLKLLLARAIARAHGGELSAQVEQGHLLLRCVLPIAT